MKVIDMKSLGRFAVLAGVVTLTACGGGGSEGEPPVVTMGVPTYVDVQNAVCEGQFEDAKGMLVKMNDNGAAGAQQRMYEGYVEEQTGALMSARQSYAMAAQSEPGAMVDVTCGEGQDARVLLQGAINDVVLERVTAINAKLADMDVTDEQLASMDVIYPPPPEPAPEPDDEMMADEPPVQVIRPAAPKLSDVWIHLASYRTNEGAAKGWTQLENRFPALQSYEPVMRHVTIPKKGQMVRLGAIGFKLEADAQALCKVIKRKKQYCMLRSD